MRNLFGEKLKRLREERGISQTELGKRLGHEGNSYIHDVERGAFVPPQEKLRDMARALDVPYRALKEMALEARLDGLGFREPLLVGLLKDYPRLTQEDRAEVMRAYLKVKQRKQRRDHGQDH